MKTKSCPKHAPAAALWIAVAALVGCAADATESGEEAPPSAPAAPDDSDRASAPGESAAQAERPAAQNDSADAPMANGAATPSTPDDEAGDKPNEPAAAPGGPAATASNPGFVAYPDLRGGCSINSGFEDDRACIPPPAPGEGMQIHIGPKNYDDPAEVAKYVMHPGEESSECWIYRTPNEQDILYQTYVLSGRAGTHHILGSMLKGEIETDTGFGRCAGGGGSEEENPIENLGPMPMATKAYMPRGQVAPENRNIAHRIPANVIAQADMHYYNLTERDILREIWINIYFVPPEQVTGEMLRVRGMGGFGWSRDTPIEPGTDAVYQYECPIVGNGRILSLLGHYHAHGRRFTASLKRKAGSIEKIFEMYDYRDPAGFEYDSVSMNPAFSDSMAGAVSGILEVSDGDVLAWECHIVNDSDVALRYVNEVNTGEMCNLWGQSHGIEEWNCLKN